MGSAGALGIGGAGRQGGFRGIAGASLTGILARTAGNVVGAEAAVDGVVTIVAAQHIRAISTLSTSLPVPPSRRSKPKPRSGGRFRGHRRACHPVASVELIVPSSPSSVSLPLPR